MQVSGDKSRFMFISQSCCLSVALLLTLGLDSSHCTKNAAIHFKTKMFQANFHFTGLDIRFLLHAVRAVIGTECLTMTYCCNLLHHVKGNNSVFMKPYYFIVLNPSLFPVPYHTTLFQSQFK